MRFSGGSTYVLLLNRPKDKSKPSRNRPVLISVLDRGFDPGKSGVFEEDISEGDSVVVKRQNPAGRSK
jgi:hypothetical protein